jgi:hypothetical protein
MYRQEILKKANNIGSLSSFLRNPKNVEYLEELNSNIPIEALEFSISEKMWYYINNINQLQLCSCGKMLSYMGLKNGYRKTCGNKECFVKARKETSIENWGVDNPRKSEEIKDKTSKTILEKYNGKHYMFDDSVRDKFKSTMIENHGVEWAQQNVDIKNKSIETWNNNPNKEEIINNRNKVLKSKNHVEINNKKELTKINKYGSIEEYKKDLSLKIKESFKQKELDIPNYRYNINIKKSNSYKNTIINKIKSNLDENTLFISKYGNIGNTDSIYLMKCLKCKKEFNINRQLFVLRKSNEKCICLNCNPILSGKSGKEIELLNFIKENYSGEIITNTKSVINPLELDIYLPELKLAFEFNGLYWHSEEYKEKNYHLNKKIECLKKDIQLFHIWEDDWDNKKSILKSMILNKLGKSNKICARKCKIKVIEDSKLVREFLDNNHIQGFVGSKIKLGLYYNNELVSLMTFGSLRKNMNSKSKEGSYELLRFCNKLDVIVIGGASRLFKFFIENYKPVEIISYSDYSRSVGNLYTKLGFSFDKLSDIGYYWFLEFKREYRFNFRKDVLVKQGYDFLKTEVEIMHERGYRRIFDCGMQKWIYNI